MAALGVVACFREGDVPGDTHAATESSSSGGATAAMTATASSSDTTHGDPTVGSTSVDPDGDSSSHGTDDRGESSTSDDASTSDASDASTSETGIANECYACLMMQVGFCGCDGDCEKLGDCLYGGGDLGVCCTDG
ncbi:MAG TPA: hypothetical protein VG755_37130, partial [Nannocystaceae bacterium]|nr:hypothetical protein [Nannocystaceae bacterium]